MWVRPAMSSSIYDRDDDLEPEWDPLPGWDQWRMEQEADGQVVDDLEPAPDPSDPSPEPHSWASQPPLTDEQDPLHTVWGDSRITKEG